MKIKSLVSICGKINMKPGEVKEVLDDVGAEMVRCGFAEAVDEPTPSKKKNTKKETTDEG